MRSLAVVAALLLPALAAGVQGIPDPSRVLDFTERAPIVIVGDAMLELGGAVGVRGGSGTAADPYRIEGWYIDGDDWRANGERVVPFGVLLQQTTKHVLVRGNVVVGSAPAGIHLVNVQNVVVEDNLIGAGFTRNSARTDSLRIDGGRDVVVRGNTVVNDESHRPWTGLRASRTLDLVVEDNTFRSTDLYLQPRTSVALVNTTDAIVRGNTIDLSGPQAPWLVGLELSDTLGGAVEANTILGAGLVHGDCVRLLRTTDVRVEGNTISGCALSLLARSDFRTTLRDNTLRDGAVGLLWDRSLGGGHAAGNLLLGLARPWNVTGTGPEAYAHDIAADNLVGGNVQRPVLWIASADGATVDASGAALVYVVASRDVTVQGVATSGQAVGVTVVDSSGVVVSDASLAGNDLGLRALRATGLRVDRLAGGAVLLESSHGARVANATLAGGAYGVRLLATDASTLDHVLVEGASVGVDVVGGSTNRVERSVVRGNGVGVRLHAPDHAAVSDTAIEQNTVGVQHVAQPGRATRADLRDNWWGSASGPRTSAAGAGGDLLVRIGSTTTTWSPWLAEAPAGAGPV